MVATDRPSVAIGSLGGTIAMTPADGAGGVTPGLTAEDLVASVPAIQTVAEVSAHSISSMGSPGIQLSDIGRALEFAQSSVEEGATGVVLTLGTDTLEEAAYLLDLWWRHHAPLVVTGAMRSADHVSADGPGNILTATIVAASPTARGMGVLVALNDTVNYAVTVTKTDTRDVAAFQSPGFGPAGVISEGTFNLLTVPTKPRRVLPQPTGQLSDQIDIAVIEAVIADDPRIIDLIIAGPHRGLVINGVGAGHVSPASAEAISRAIDAGMSIVIATRCHSGGTARATYGYPGAEIDLQRRGAIMAGPLSGRKARLLLHLLLEAGYQGEALATEFRLLASSAE